MNKRHEHQQKVISLRQARTRRRREQRVVLTLYYMRAIEEGNHELASKILALAVHDPELDQLLEGVEEEMMKAAGIHPIWFHHHQPRDLPPEKAE